MNFFREHYSRQNEKIKEMEQKLVEIQSKRDDKKSKGTGELKKPSIITYGPKMSLPCCFGSKTPCNRQIEFNKHKEC